MQVTRLISVLTLFYLWCTYFFIYVRGAFFQYSFVALTVTLAAFVCLFVGSGKQVVYQKLVADEKISYTDKKKKSNLWKKGVFLYTQAIPLIAVSNLIYFVDFKKLTHHIAQKLHWKCGSSNPSMFCTLVTNNQSIADDVSENIQLNYQKTYQHSGPKYWRQDFIWWAHVVPAGCLVLDMLMNKIKMRLNHVWF